MQGSGIWLAVGIVISGLRLISRIHRRSRDVVYSAELAPGETVNIAHLLEDYAGKAVEITGRKGRVTRVRT